MGALGHSERAVQQARGFRNIVDIIGSSGDMLMR